MSVVGALIEVTGGNVRNDHFYLRDAQFLFPASVVQGNRMCESKREQRRIVGRTYRPKTSAIPYLLMHMRFPCSVVGGSNSDDKAENELTVEFVPGSTVKTDIAGDKMILRNRSAVRDFFQRAGVEEGDRILGNCRSSCSSRVEDFALSLLELHLCPS
jgi:hypothetical protein